MRNRKPLSTSALRNRHKSGKKNKGSPVVFKRQKSDSTVIRQHEIYLKIKQYPGLRKDFWKQKQWWDFAIEKERIVIKIVSKNYKVNNLKIETMKKLGWNVLFINYFDDSGESLESLVKQIEFALDKKNFIEVRSKELNKDLPASECWFQNRIQKEWFWSKMKFALNKPMFGKFIYDLFSEPFRLCIEIDGSVHDNIAQQQKDAFKNTYTRSKGFHIIRVQAYNDESYKDAVLLIEQIVNNSKSKTFKAETQSDFNNTIKELDKSGKLPF